MRLRHLAVRDFRSYPQADLDLPAGVTVFLGLNGQGKTNLIEAVGYLATLGSHRVSVDQPLVRYGAEHAMVRGAVVREKHESIAEMQIVPGRANRARLGRTTLAKPREILGTLRTVLFAPEDLALVKGDPATRRAYLDGLLVARQPRWAGVQADFATVLRQRNALLRGLRGSQLDSSAHASLAAWNEHLATLGASLLYARLRLLADLRGHLQSAYTAVSAGATTAAADYRWSLVGAPAEELVMDPVPERDVLKDVMLFSLAQVASREVERGVTLVGPHRDELELTLGPVPAKGYASHGESWSLALALRIAAFRLLREDLGTDPVLVLDDVFAELDSGRRERLAELVADTEQVLVTAAVESDVPIALRERAHLVDVTLGEATARGRD